MTLGRAYITESRSIRHCLFVDDSVPFLMFVKPVGAPDGVVKTISSGQKIRPCLCYAYSGKNATQGYTEFVLLISVVRSCYRGRS